MEDFGQFVANKVLFEAGINLMDFLQIGLSRFKLPIFLIEHS